MSLRADASRTITHSLVSDLGQLPILSFDLLMRVLATRPPPIVPLSVPNFEIDLCPMHRQKLRYSGNPNHDLNEVPEQKLLAATEVVPKNLNPSWERVLWTQARR